MPIKRPVVVMRHYIGPARRREGLAYRSVLQLMKTAIAAIRCIYSTTESAPRSVGS